MRKWFQTVIRKFARQQVIALMVIIVMTGVGIYFLASGHAQSPFAANEAAAGTVTSPATVVPVSTASGSSAVQFGSSISSCDATQTGGMLNESAFVASTNAPASASDAPQNAISNAVDTMTSTRFSTDEDQAPGLYFEVNMGSAQTFNEIDMVVTSSDYARGFTVEVSANGTSWTQVTSCTGTSSPEVVSFPTQTAQYLRVVLNTSWASNWWSITQFSIYGSGGTSSWAGFPASFWGNTSAIPAATHTLEFDFINATNGAYPDSEVYYTYNGTTYTVAQQPYLDVGICTSCRVTFYLGSPTSQYSDFMEFDIGTGGGINFDTSRVDQLGLPLALHLHNQDGSDQVIGENYTAFSETRATLFQQFINFVPPAFQQLATVDAPYSIPSPGNLPAFQPGGADASYMSSYAASLGYTETTQEIFDCRGGGSPDFSDDASLCAALNRGVAQDTAAQQLDPSLYYQTAPYNYYSAFVHSIAVNGQQYGFATDDQNGQSSDIQTGDPQYLQLAVGY